MTISPDGRWAALQVRQADATSNDYDLAWFVISTTTGEATRIGDGCDPIIARTPFGAPMGAFDVPPPLWSRDSLWIAYLCQEHGVTQLWRSRIDGRVSEQISHGDRDVTAFAFAERGARLLFATAATQAQNGAAIDAEGLSGFLFDERFPTGVSTRPARPSAELADTRTQIWVFNTQSGRITQATLIEQAELEGLTARAPSVTAGRRLSVASAVGNTAWVEALDRSQQGDLPPLTVSLQRANSKVPFRCEARACTGQRMVRIWWRDEEEIAFATREGAAFQEIALYAWRPRSEPQLILRAPAGAFDTNGECRCEIAQRALVCLFEQLDRPRRLVAIDLDSGAIRTLFDPNEGFAAYDLGPAPRRIDVNTPGGVHAFGYLVLPPNAPQKVRFPLVIVTYRCSGFLRGGVGDEYPIYPLAAQGFAVFCFDAPTDDFARLARMSLGDYQSWARGPGDPQKRNVQAAIDAAIQQLDALGVIDPDRVALNGLSFGADTVQYALLNMPRLKVAIASSVPMDPIHTVVSSARGRESLRQWGLGAYDSPRWKSISLARNAERVRAPLLLNVADSEQITALPAFVALRDARRPVEMHIFPDELHIKRHPAHRLAIYNRNIDWLNFWLRGVQDPDHTKAGQYARWRAMRENQCHLLSGPDTPWYCRQDSEESASQ